MTRTVCLAAVAALALVFATGTAGRPALAQAALTSGGPVDPAMLEDLASAYRVLANQGIIDGYGHVSMRHPKSPNRYLMSRSLGPALVTPADIMEFDLDSTPIDPKGRNAVLERFIHGEIYKARPDVMVVIHSHAPSVVPFSISTVPLRPVFHMATFLGINGGKVPVWDSRSVNDPAAAALLVRTPAMGKSLAATLGKGPVALLRGHGDVVVGPNIPLTVRQAIYTEVNAKVLLSALALGGPVTYVSQAETDAVEKTPGDIMRGWELWKREAALADK
jgi:HCOMODA/2-hydroxy-3-carboxy-muconic semialdehyde decarboxylase